MLTQYSIFIVDKLQQIIDLKRLDDHQSLTFLKKNYNINPSDIIALAIAFLALLIIFIQGLRIVLIIMCYLLPTGLMVLKLAQAMKMQNQENSNKDLNKQKQFKTKQLQANKQKNEEQLTQQSSSLSIQKPVVQKKGILNKVTSSLDKNLTKTQISKIFISYFSLSLTIDLIQPFVLSIIYYIIYLVEYFIYNLTNTILYGQFWQLILYPFHFVFGFFAVLVNFNDFNYTTKIIWLVIRILATMVLLSRKQYLLKLFAFVFQSKIQKQEETNSNVNINQMGYKDNNENNNGLKQKKQ